jgi:hypothetical protein
MFELDIKAMLANIEATVVPELPADHHPDNLEKYVAAVMAQLILADDQERVLLLRDAIPEAKRVNDQMLEFTTYLAGISKEKFASYPDETKTKLEGLSILVQRSTSIAHVYSNTLLNVGGRL